MTENVLKEGEKGHTSQKTYTTTRLDEGTDIDQLSNLSRLSPPAGVSESHGGFLG